MIVPMTRLRMAVPRSRLDDLLRFVASRRLFHPANPADDSFLAKRGSSAASRGEEGDELAVAERLRANVDDALAALPDREDDTIACPFPPDDGSRWLASPLRERAEGVSRTVLKSARLVTMAQGELREVASYLRLFMTFMPLLRMIGTSEDMEAIGVVFHPGEEASGRDLEVALERVTHGAGVVLSTPDTDEGSGGALLVFPRSMLAKVRAVAHETGAAPMKLPERYEQETFATTVARLFDARAELTERIAREQDRLAMKGARWGTFLAEASAGLSQALAPLRARRHVVVDGPLCWLAGWVPADRLPPFRRDIVDALDGAITFHEATPLPDETERTPVLLRNPAWSAPFEQALRLYALPQYGSFDPTSVSAALFLFYFGMTLGDVGYGALLLGLSLWAGKRWRHNPVVVDASRFGALASGVAILFGVLYGEMLGPLWREIGLPGPLFDREHGADTLLLVSLAIGAAAITGGLLLAARVAWRRGERREGVDRLADAGVVIAMVAGGGLAMADLSVDGAVALGIVAFAVKLYTCRPMTNLLEAPRLLSNVLSHARLMALGIAAVSLADLAHEVARLPESLLVGVVLGGVFHLLSFTIGVAGPAIHSGRLLFVEFFGQFYEAGGKPYAPLG